MKKRHLIISGSIILIFGPVLGLLLCVEGLKWNFDRLAESGTAVPIALLATSVSHCTLWTIAGVVVGFIGLALLIFGLVKKSHKKPLGSAGLDG